MTRKFMHGLYDRLASIVDRRLSVVVLTSVPFFVLGWFLVDFGERITLKEIEWELTEGIATTSALLSKHLSGPMTVVKLMAREEKIHRVLHEPQSVQAVTAANQLMDQYKEISGVDVTGLYTAQGRVLATYKDGLGFLGRDLSFRPYIQRAMQGEDCQYLALGHNEKRRGYYAATPVRSRDGQALGVAMVKNEIREDLVGFDQTKHAYFVSPDGVIFLSSNPDLLYRTFWPIPARRLHELRISKQFGAHPLKPLQIDWKPESREARWGKKNLIYRQAQLGPTGWRLFIFKDKSPIFRSQILMAAIAFTLFLIGDLGILMLIREKETARLLAASNLELERRVDERTAELSKSNQDLQMHIKERKKAEEAIRKSEESLRITLNSIGDAVISADQQGKIIRMNPVAESLTGWSFAEAEGLPVGRAFHTVKLLTGEPSKNPVEEVLRTGQGVGASDDVLLTKKDGAQCRISAIASPIREAEGPVEGAVLVFRDVTKQRSMEEELQQIDKLDSIGELAGGIAHDFKNMLGGILGTAEILYHEAGSKSNGYIKQYVQMIIDATIRASELTEKLLAFSRRSEIFLKPFDTHVAIREAIAVLDRSIDRRIRLEMQLDAEQSFLSGDSSQFQTAVLNMCINAGDAMPQGGMLTVSTRNVELDEAYCSASPFELTPGRYIHLKVSDNGVGIRPDIQKRIFEPFFTTKEHGRGTGLGLAAVYGTVLSHKGSVTVTSEPDKGTEFHLYFPAALAPEASLEVRNSEELLKASGCVLVVDDEELLRSLAREMLTLLGYEVILAENGAEGVSRFQANRDRIDVVILDIMMPVMDGYECFRQIRNIDPQVKVLICTGYADSTGGLNELRLEGIEAVVPKPYRLAELSRVLAGILGKS